MEIDVGSIIYIIDSARINEQVISKTVEGESITHNIELPSGKKVNLEGLNSMFYSSLSEVRAYLLDRAGEIIETGIKHAESVAHEKFTREPTEAVDTESASIATNYFSGGSDKVKITLEDGTIANVNMPPEFLNENTDY